MQLTNEELELLKQCSGKHNTLDELFNCVSCAVLFKEVKEQ